MNAELIKGINAVIEGLTVIKNSLTEEIVKPVDEVVTQTNVVEEVSPNSEETINGYTKEHIEGMKYNEFKKFAAQLGVKCTGTRSEIMERILAIDSPDSVGEKVETPNVEEVDNDESKNNSKSRKGKREAINEVPETDEFDDMAKTISEDTSIEEIIEALADVEIKATKKNAIEKLAYALREGLIEADGDEDSEEDLEEDPEEDEDIVDEDTADEIEEEDEDEVEIEADSYFKQFDPKGYNDPETMTEERKEAVVNKMDEILTAISEDELTHDDIEKYIEEHATEEEIDLLSNEYTEDDELMLYMELIKRTIDNDGEEHTEGEDPYELGEYDMCCGHELKYVKKTKRYICEHCGTEYEA